MNSLKVKLIFIIILTLTFISSEINAMNNECTQDQMDKLQDLQRYWTNVSELFAAQYEPKASAAAKTMQSGVESFSKDMSGFLVEMQKTDPVGGGELPTDLGFVKIWDLTKQVLNSHELGEAARVANNSKKQVPLVNTAVQACARSLERQNRGGVSGSDEEEHDDHPNALGGSDGDDRIGGGSNCMLCGSLDIPEEIITTEECFPTGPNNEGCPGGD